jgi:site-specific DNA-methyltransferase (cytosine-N4-specific)
MRYTEKASKTPLIERLACFTKPSQYDTTYLTHGIHPYPAKYIPQLPREIILEHTNERNTILDPFCGSGTTLLEACILGRKSIGVDSNPIAVLISRAKTQTLNQEDLLAAENLLQYLSERELFKKLPDTPIPPIPRIEHWFQDNVVRELGFLKSLIEPTESTYLREFLLCVFSSIIVAVSNQESETRYAAKNKNIANGYVLHRFTGKLKDAIKKMKGLSQSKKARSNTPVVYNLDSRFIDREIIPDNSIDLVVTSPPYPNSYDYYLYHKMRMYWLGHDPQEAKELEIGSRNEHSSKKASIRSFEEKMTLAIQNISRVLKPSKLSYFFVGDAIINGELINMKDVFCRIASISNLKFVAENDYSLEKVSRSFHEKRFSLNHNKHHKKQRILIFESVAPRSQVLVSKRVIASPTATWKLTKLNGTIPDKSKIAIQSNDFNRHIHSLGKYPSKFIPEIPKWAITQFSKPGDWILDPFIGAGTTAVEALLLSRNAVVADFSPYACLLTKAKTLALSPKTLQLYATKFLSSLDDRKSLPKKERPRFDYDSFWFNTTYLEEIERIKNFILVQIPRSSQSFFLAALSTVIKPSSFLDESQVKVKRDPKKVISGTPSPIDLLKQKIPPLVQRFTTFRQLSCPNSKVQIIQEAAHNLCPTYVKYGSIDLVVTSPPYINAMNYPMIHRYENMLLCGIDESERIEHEQGYYGTERVYAQDYSHLHQFEDSFCIAEYLNPRLKKIFAGEPKRSFIVYRYFCQVYKAFENIVDTLKPGGRFVIVAGTNVIKGVPIDTFKVIVSLLEDLGLKYCSSFHYEIIKNTFKLRRHSTANLIKMDGVCVLEKTK